MTIAPLTVTMPAAHVCLITLQRPSQRNALTHETMVALADALEAADANSDVRAVVMAGDARVFAAGADLREMAALDGPALAEHPRTVAWRRIAAVGVPVIAAVEGVALGGGCELVQCCDIAIAGADARFGQPEIGIGWMPGAGGTQRLPRAVGKSLAMQMVLTGEPITAARACEAGLVSEVVPAGEALPRALAIGSAIAAHAPAAIRHAKASVLAAYRGSIEDGLADERGRFQALASSEERREGIAAFLEKRPPSWRD
ncbi:MAG: enoyl-CoA hydratase-related protein [Gemmatimonadaceae bacterium]|nr:enoyl-CoA hydratase-related protein [Gemmatimonadaceae bacterium]